MVKILNREIGNRMWGGKSNVYGVSGGGTGGGDVDLSSYATMAWTKQNFVSIEYFRTLFKAFDSNDDEIVPNNTTSVVDNIKAMVGLWTEQYLTALGNQSGGGGGGGGAQYLNDLLDVELTTPLTDGQALVYNATLQKWVNGAAGVNMTTVWNALAGSTNEQINASHLSTALSGYVTTSAISDMATQTWVGQQGFATQTWVTSNFITIAYFDRLFRAYNGSTLVSHNDTTSTIDNIKAMFGFWTDAYMTALGSGGSIGSSIYLSQLADVNVAEVTNGQVLSYNSTNAEWVPTTISNVTSLSALTDVALSSLQTNQVLIYDSTSSKWINSSLKTVNGYSILGSGDIPASGGTTGNYLPLAGGTMSGAIQSPINGYVLYFGSNNRYVIGSNTTTDFYFADLVGSADFKIYTNGSYPLYIKGSTKKVGINTESPISPLHVVGDIFSTGTLYSQHDGYAFYFGENLNYIMGSNTTYNMYLGDSTGAGDILFYTNSIYPLVIKGGSGNIGIGTTSPSYKLHVNGYAYSTAFIAPAAGSHTQGYFDGGLYLSEMNPNATEIRRCGISVWSDILNFTTRDLSGSYLDVLFSIDIYTGNTAVGNYGTVISYKFQVMGDIYATGGVTALSDIRHKTVIKDAAVSVEDIARMPAVMYQWNDGREDKELHVGSIAQNWQTVLPEVVLKANDEEGTLSMQYGVAALVSSIIIARKVVNHEERINQLEKENKELKKRLNIA